MKRKLAKEDETLPCPCGAAAYEDCCGRFIGQRAVPQTALELMRSRYTAFTLDDETYLQATWHPRSRPAPSLATQEKVKWLGLDVCRHAQSGDEATVEFVARWKAGGKAQRLHEVSRFIREDGHWFYLDGSFPESEQHDR